MADWLRLKYLDVYCLGHLFPTPMYFLSWGRTRTGIKVALYKCRRCGHKAGFTLNWRRVSKVFGHVRWHV